MNLEMIDLEKEETNNYGLNGSIQDEDEIDGYNDNNKGLRRRLVGTNSKEYDGGNSGDVNNEAIKIELDKDSSGDEHQALLNAKKDI